MFSLAGLFAFYLYLLFAVMIGKITPEILDICGYVGYLENINFAEVSLYTSGLNLQFFGNKRLGKKVINF